MRLLERTRGSDSRPGSTGMRNTVPDEFLVETSQLKCSLRHDMKRATNKEYVPYCFAIPVVVTVVLVDGEW